VEELTPEQTSELRISLVARRDELLRARSQNEEGAKPVDLDEPIGRLSRMEAIQQQHMTQANRRNQGEELREVSSALADMDSGDYGYCRQCEEPIGFRRLRARPHSRICVACQGKLEAMAGFGEAS
jgi:DnaK suppressor protein